MMRISQGHRLRPQLVRAQLGLVLVALGALASAGPAHAQSQRSGIEQSPLPPPPGMGSSGTGMPTAPDPRRGSARPAPAPTAAPAPAAPTEGDMVVVRPPAVRIHNRIAVYAGLDKITGRTTTFDVAIGETAQFGALQVTPRVCYTRPEEETRNVTSFTEVNEVTLKGEAKRIFTGWMFASSPGLHGVEHPVYDVWLIGCKAPAPVTAAPAGQQ